MADELQLQRFIPFRKKRRRRNVPGRRSPAGFGGIGFPGLLPDSRSVLPFQISSMPPKRKSSRRPVSPTTSCSFLVRDHAVEKWLAEGWNCGIHFEIDDALKKLERLGIISILADKRRCRPLEDAKRHLDKSWDNFF
jgi:hypothetical protein